ncbi:hypothetical protein LIZ98_05185 [Caldibacillus sp. 210928-DFI.2.18]|nr:hypothetical protein [Caldibacillus sp. 210928-DFI.2.18]
MTWLISDEMHESFIKTKLATRKGIVFKKMGGFRLKTTTRTGLVAKK